jgi:hypothetical protein
MVSTEHPKMGTMTGPPLAKKSKTVDIGIGHLPGDIALIIFINHVDGKGTFGVQFSNAAHEGPFLGSDIVGAAHLPQGQASALAFDVGFNSSFSTPAMFEADPTADQSQSTRSRPP